MNFIKITFLILISFLISACKEEAQDFSQKTADDYILFDLFFGFTSYSVGPIAHFAHIGGAITGFVMMWYWKKNQFNDKRWN